MEAWGWIEMGAIAGELDCLSDRSACGKNGGAGLFLSGVRLRHCLAEWV